MTRAAWALGWVVLPVHSAWAPERAGSTAGMATLAKRCRAASKLGVSCGSVPHVHKVLKVELDMSRQARGLLLPAAASWPAGLTPSPCLC